MKLLFIFLFLPVICFAETIEQNLSDNGSTQKLIMGQTFTVGSTGENKNFTLESVTVNFIRLVNEAILVEIYNTSGGLPTGSAISSGTIIADGASTQWRIVSLSSVNLLPGTTYMLGITTTNQAQFPINTPSSYAGGNALSYSGGSWSANTYDCLFVITGSTTLSEGIIAASQSVCYDNDVPLLTSTANASGGTGTLVYTWQYSTTSSVAGEGSWTDIGSSNSATYDPPTLTATRYYVRRVQDGFDVTYSNVLTINVYGLLTPPSISGNQTVCHSQNVAALTTLSVASGGSGNYTYTWQYSTTSNVAGSGTWTNISPQNILTYTPGPLTVTTYFTLRVADMLCGTVYSNVITIIVYPNLTSGSIGSNQSISPGGDVAAFTSIASASGGSSSYTYTWQYSTTSNVAGSGVWTDVIGSNTTTYNHGTITQTTWFTRRVVDAMCGTARSNVLQVTVSAPPAGDCNPNIYTPIYRYTCDNTAADSSSFGRTAKLYGNASFSSGTKAVGSHSLVLDGGNDYIRIPKVDYADKILITMFVRSNADITANKMLFCIANSTSNFYIIATPTNIVKVYTVSNSVNPNITLTPGAFHHLAVYIEKRGTSTICRTWFNGVQNTMTDSLLSSSFNSNDSAFIGVDYYRNGDWAGYFDEVMAFTNFTPSTADINCIRNLGYMNTAAPPAPKKSKIRNQVTQFPTYYTPYVQIDPILDPGEEEPIDSVLIPNYGYNYHHTLAVKQKFAIPENVLNGDYVGKWLKTFTWTLVGTAQYTLQNSHNGAFAINSTSGLITIADPSKINGKIIQQDTVINLIVRTTDTGLTFEDDTAQIAVKENAYCRFFDFGGAGDSTRSNPANYIPLGAKRKGYGYFLKRGVTYTNPGLVTSRGHIATGVHHTVVGAWGTGAKPRVRSTVANFTAAFEFGYYPNVAPWYSDSVDRAENIDIYDIHFQNYWGSAISVFMPASHIGMYNLDIMNCNRQGGKDAIKMYDANYIDSSWYMPNWITNLVADTTGSSGTPGTAGNKAYIKCGGGPLFLSNFDFGEGGDQTIPFYALRLTNGRHSVIKHGYIHPESVSDPTDLYASGGIQNRQKSVLYEDLIIEGSNQGIYSITNDSPNWHNSPDNITIRNVYFKNNDLYGFLMRQGDYDFWNSENNLIENCLFENAPTALLLREWRNGIIRRNIFKGGGTGISCSTTELTIGMQIYFNLFQGQASNAIIFPNASTVKINHNTAYGTINVTGSTSVSANNNLYRVLTGPYTGSGNRDIDGLNIYDNFVDPLGGNWKLLPASVLIDQGINLTPQPSPDLTGVTVPQGSLPDPGANELPQ